MGSDSSRVSEMIVRRGWPASAQNALFRPTFESSLGNVALSVGARPHAPTVYSQKSAYPQINVPESASPIAKYLNGSSTRPALLASIGLNLEVSLASTKPTNTPSIATMEPDRIVQCWCPNRAPYGPRSRSIEIKKTM